MSRYLMRDDGGSENLVEAPSMQEAVKLAHIWVRGGSWHTSEQTVYVSVRVFGYDNEEGESESFSVTLPQDEPSCTEGDHNWQAPYDIVGGLKENPGVFGKGGGVLINECCMNCGCQKQTDTWAQNPCNGVQGLMSITYTRNAYDLSDDLSKGENDG